MLAPGQVVVPMVVAVLAVGAPPGDAWVEEDCVALVDAEGTQEGDLFGDRVEGVGDVTGDGVPDFAVSAPFFNTNRGRVSVHSGVDGEEVWGRTTSTTSTILGFSLAVVGDLDDDGAREVLAGAPFAGNTGGFVFVYSGADGTILHTYQGDPVGFNASIGYSIATGGDFNGDGVEDIAIADAGNDALGPNAGRMCVYSSADFSLICEIYPPELPAARFGTGSAFLGDVTGDGRDDIVVADRYESGENAGRLHVFAYEDDQPVFRYSIQSVNLGCTLCGDPVGGGRDVDGDGVGDIIISEASPDFRARVFSGVDGTLVRTFDEVPSQSADLVDDVDGDGLADVLAGDRSNGEGGAEAGQVVLLAGRTGHVLRTLTSTDPGAGFGTRVAPFTDLDGDGLADYLVGARPGLGNAYVMAGTRVASAGDVNGDGVVDFADLVLILSAWGPCDDCPEDLDDSGSVDFDDLVLLLGNWS